MTNDNELEESIAKVLADAELSDEATELVDSRRAARAQRRDQDLEEGALKELFVRQMMAKQGGAGAYGDLESAAEELIRAALDGDEEALRAAKARLNAPHKTTTQDETD